MQITAVRTLTSKLAAPGLSSNVVGSAITVTCTPPTPTGQSVIAGYRFRRATAVSGPYTLVQDSASTTFAETQGAGTYYYTVEAYDQFVTGVASSAQSATVQPATSLRTTYGHYATFDYASGINATKFANGDSALIASVATNATIGDPPDNLMGFALVTFWRSLDTGTVGPSYQWAALDSYVNAIKAKNKQYFIWVRPDGFVSSGHSCSTGTRCVPDWLINAHGLNGCQGNYSPLGKGVFPKWYNSFMVTAMNDLFDQIIARYGSDPNCEGVVFLIGTANASFNGVDNLGTNQPQINYNSDYQDTGMIAALKTFMGHFRSQTSSLNFWFTGDYLFNMAGSSSWAGQDVQWDLLFQSAITNKCIMGGVDSWTRNWVYPDTPFTSTGQNPYNANNNASYNRAVPPDQVYRGWRSATPGVGTGYRGLVLEGACQELTEMGGYIGQFSAADVWSYRGPALDNVNYMLWDINYAQSGNYGTDPGVTTGAPKAPNTLWLAATSYDATYGQSVYRWIQTAGPTNQVNPYG